MKANEFNHNYIRNQKNKLSRRYEAVEKLLKENAEKKIKHEERYGGHPDLINEGSLDRINGQYPKTFDDQHENTSYYYGFYEKGSRLLSGEFSKGTFTEEEQTNFGMNDVNNNIPEEFLKELKTYPAYLQGRIYQLGRNSYSFISETGTTFEEYIGIMSIMYPEFGDPKFKQGYLDEEKQELNKNKR